MHRLALKCQLKVVVHGVNFHVGHLFHSVVVLAMVELEHALGYTPSWNQVNLYLQAPVLMNG